MSTLTIGLPKGSLQEPTVELFRQAGWNIYISSRGYKPNIDDSELEGRVLRAQEIARYINGGFLDCGITGRDWIAENGADLEVLCDLPYSKATSNPTRWVLAVPESSPIQTVQDLEGKRISTEAVGLVERYLAKHKVNAKVEFSWGATEAKVPDLVDAIVDITETGSSLRANNLRIVETLMTSYPQFVMNKQAFADPQKRRKAESIALMLQSSLQARGKSGLKMNLPEEKLEEIKAILPSLHSPTINKLADPNWLAVETVIEEKQLREILPQLLAAGAEGIIEYPLNKILG